MTAAAVALRIGKNWGLGPVQFINISLIFGYMSSYVFGFKEGFMVGFTSQFISDLLIFPGPWTLVTSVSSGFFSSLSSLFRNTKDFTMYVVALFMLTLGYDVVTSTLGYVMIGYTPLEALIVALIGLFIPAGGGWLIGVGPTTEAVTSIVASSLVKALRRSRVMSDIR